MVKVDVSKVKSINKKHKNETSHKTIKPTKLKKLNKQNRICKTLKENVEKTKGKEKKLLLVNLKKSQTNPIKPKTVLNPLVLKKDDISNWDENNIKTPLNSKKRKAGIGNVIVEKEKKLKKIVNQANRKIDNGHLNTIKTSNEKDENYGDRNKQKEVEKFKQNKGKIQKKNTKEKRKTSCETKAATEKKSIVETENKVECTQIPNEENCTYNISENCLDEVQKEEQKKDEDKILEEDILNFEYKNEMKFKNAKVKPLTEEAFDAILNKTNIENLCNSFETLLQREISKMKNLVINDYRYMLNVTSYKMPNCPKRMVKLNLRHSLVDVDKDDVVLIVADLKRGAKLDYEPTIQHYQDLFQEAGISQNLKIRPFNQVRNECKTYEGKRKFANSFDYFMCDGRIVSHVNGFCGKVLHKPRTTMHAVRMNKLKNLKREIEHSLKRTAYRQLEKGDLIAIPVGHSRLTINELTENIKYVIEQLKKIYPGSYENIRHIYLRADIRGTSAIPLFINLAEPPQHVPQVIGTREQRLLKLKSETNKILKNFNLSKAATVVKLNKSAIKKKTTLAVNKI